MPDPSPQLTDLTDRAKAVRDTLAFTDLLDTELDSAIGIINDLIADVRRLRAAIAAVDAIERWPYNPVTMQGFELDQAQGYNDALAEVRRALHPEADQ